MEPRYDATYHSKTGNSIIHVVCPSSMTGEEVEEGIRKFHNAGWKAWNGLSANERLRLNGEVELK